MIAYLDLSSGLSGDMFLSCLVDAGWSVESLRETLALLSFPKEEFEIRAHEVRKGPLRAMQVSVDVKATYHQRNLTEIRSIVAASKLGERVKDRAMSIFTKLAEAEAKVHGMSLDEVHFHEVGAVDAIVDIVGAAAGIEALHIEQLYASAVPLGEGWVNSAHGMLPLPAPATLELLAAAKAPTRPAPGPGELITPTGAAILAACATFTQPQMKLHRIALGAGQKNFAWPNIARLWLGESTEVGAIVQMDTNIDDMNPQLYPVVIDRCLAAGALDAWTTPVQMKKGRPGIVLSVLTSTAKEVEVSELILRETTTLGVRVHPVYRHEARRESVTVATPYGEVRIKLKYLDDRIVGATPEFEDCRRLADEKGASVQEVMRCATVAVSSTIQDSME